MSVRTLTVHLSRAERRRKEREIDAARPDGLDGSGWRRCPYSRRGTRYRVRELSGPLVSLEVLEAESDAARARINDGCIAVDCAPHVTTGEQEA